MLGRMRSMSVVAAVLAALAGVGELAALSVLRRAVADGRTAGDVFDATAAAHQVHVWAWVLAVAGFAGALAALARAPRWTWALWALVVVRVAVGHLGADAAPPGPNVLYNPAAPATVEQRYEAARSVGDIVPVVVDRLGAALLVAAAAAHLLVLLRGRVAEPPQV